MGRAILSSVALLLVGLFLLACGGEHARAPSGVVTVPLDLKETVDRLVRALDVLDVAEVLDTYAEDFTSGTGRSKGWVADVLRQLRANRISLVVERAEVEEMRPGEAKVRMHLRLRYTDYFRNLGEGEVIVTDILMHWLRKEAGRWKIYTDERLATYRDGRFGAQPPNVAVTVPEKLPRGFSYPVTVSVQRERDTVYQVMIGNYAEDPAVLPPPDVITLLPADGVLRTDLLPNPQGRSEIVRITVIAADLTGKWQGATTVSTLVPSPRRTKPTGLQRTT
jgi:hypothetical protein